MKVSRSVPRTISRTLPRSYPAPGRIAFPIRRGRVDGGRSARRCLGRRMVVGRMMDGRVMDRNGSMECVSSLGKRRTRDDRAGDDRAGRSTESRSSGGRWRARGRSARGVGRREQRDQVVDHRRERHHLPDQHQRRPGGCLGRRAGVEALHPAGGGSGRLRPGPVERRETRSAGPGRTGVARRRSARRRAGGCRPPRLPARPSSRRVRERGRGPSGARSPVQIEAEAT